MIVRWEVADGYVGAGRTQETEIDDDSIAECESQEEFNRLIEECVQEDFEQRVSWEVDPWPEWPRHSPENESDQ